MKPIFIIPTLLLSCFLATSCKPKGCTDQAATNFDAKAKKSDNSCTYEGSVVFWYDGETSQQLITSGATSLKYYFDNQLVGSTSADVFFTGAPDCGQNGSISVTKQLGQVKGKAYEYRIEDQLGIERWKGIINIEGGACVQHELAF